MTILDILNAWCGMIDGIEVCNPARNPLGHWKIDYFNKYMSNYKQGDEYKDIPEEILGMKVKFFTMQDNYYMLFYTK